MQSSKHPTQICRWLQWQFYAFKLEKDLVFGNFPGVYIFSRILEYHYYPLYIGHSVNLGKTIRRHMYRSIGIVSYSEQIQVLEAPEAELEHIEKTLIEYFNPPFNGEHRTGPAYKKIREVVPDWWDHKGVGG